MMQNRDIHNRMANAIRFLSIDAIEKAQSGHPGLPMGVADIATVLFNKFLKFDPKKPYWPDRDRFILSAGHGSMMLYALLYLTGYEDMSLDEIKKFRQLGSRTAGHPEYHLTSGIETTTGPLAQGLGNSVGFALGERIMNAAFGDNLVDHRTWVLVGDGCLMEGLSQEAISLAGHLKLKKLTVIWDNNNISIDGPVSLADSTDQIKRFSSVGWHAISCDGHDPNSLEQAMKEACNSDRPCFIAAKTIIGFGAPSYQGTHKVHGSPLGAEEVAATRKALHWNFPAFHIPSDILDAWRFSALSGAKASADWEERFSKAPCTVRQEFERRISGKLPYDFDTVIRECKKYFSSEKFSVATRKSSETVLERVNRFLPETLGGSSDLTPSNNTKTRDMNSVCAENYGNRYVHYGVREHAMVAAMNGLALHGGLIPYGGTFLCFSDYARPAMRLASLMGIRCIFVMTHDSIGLGEDGPTHQPVEHFASLRALPNHYVLRPADAVEVSECWQIALESEKTPSTLVLTRQNVLTFRDEHIDENMCRRGAYEIASSGEPAEITLFSSGSEVEIALAAREILQKNGHPTRVVSVPCFELFEEQDVSYKKRIVGDSPVRIAVEAGIRQGWDRFIGENGIFVGMSSFGASGLASDLYRYFGITPEKVVSVAEERLS